MKRIFLALCLMASVTASWGQAANLNLHDGLALQGYDPVSYFLQQKATKGRSELSYQHEGAIYHFASASNRNRFVQNPTAYLPQYGGWCAYAMGATGEKVEVDPETFKVTGGKLYLFYNRFFNNTLPKWNKDESSLKTKADRHWNDILLSKP
ncbi:MAG: YHS domain-containing protein [Cyclobacteriaceae bacterium]|nr:YHS domain-containing protein [Cyclobacteriaceae bacterium]